MILVVPLLLPLTQSLNQLAFTDILALHCFGSFTLTTLKRAIVRVVVGSCGDTLNHAHKVSRAILINQPANKTRHSVTVHLIFNFRLNASRIVLNNLTRETMNGAVIKVDKAILVVLADKAKFVARLLNFVVNSHGKSPLVWWCLSLLTLNILQECLA